MNFRHRLLTLLLPGLLTVATAFGAEPVRVLLITGGHDYETNQFLKMFGDNPGIALETAQHPKAHEWFRAENAGRYDVIVLYDLWQEITEAAQADFVARLQEGKGLVALHHSLANYQRWPGYADIIGGRYYLDKHLEGGVEKPASTYLHDVQFRVRVEPTPHPVTAGLRDFEIHDETYGGFEVKPGVTRLLTTTERTSSPVIAWAKEHGKARVATIQLGHDHLAYENPNYRRLVAQAIAWVAGSGNPQPPLRPAATRIRGELTP